MLIYLLVFRHLDGRGGVVVVGEGGMDRRCTQQWQHISNSNFDKCKDTDVYNRVQISEYAYMQRHECLKSCKLDRAAVTVIKKRYGIKTNNQ